MSNKYSENYQGLKDRQKIESDKHRQESAREVDRLNKAIPRDRQGQLKDRNEREYALGNDGLIYNKDELTKPRPTEFQQLPGGPIEKPTGSQGASAHTGPEQTASQGQSSSSETTQQTVSSQQEEQYAMDLAVEQAEEEEQEEQEIEDEEQRQLLQEAIQLYKEGQSFGHPSFFKYFVILIPWAIIVDIVDMADLTGAGAIIGRLYSFFSWASILFILWFTDGNIKRAHEYGDNLEKRIASIQKEITISTRLALRTSKVLRKVPGMKKVARAIPRGLVRARRVLRKNPLTKVLIGGAINLVPLVAVFNLLFVWVFLSYLDEKKTYASAREQSEEAYNDLLADAA